jgi:uncharacterized protein (TIGR02118 family)
MFRLLWLGQHASLAKQLVGLREYVIDFIPEAPPGLPSGIATVRFDSLEALEAAFADEQLRTRLHETRDEFASRVEVFIVDENVVFSSRGNEL